MAVTHSVVLYDPTETSAEVKAVTAGFLAGYSGRTREAYKLDLRQSLRVPREHDLGPFEVKRTHIQLYAREAEELGRTPATIGRRLSTVARFYRYAAEEGVIEHSPAMHVRGRGSTTSPTPSGSTATTGRLAGRGRALVTRDHDFCSLLALKLNGLRISEALDADIDQLGFGQFIQSDWVRVTGPPSSVPHLTSGCSRLSTTRHGRQLREPRPSNLVEPSPQDMASLARVH